MTPLGQSLVFALKYPAEMSRLDWKPKNSGENPDVTGLPETEAGRIVKMVSAVGDAACEEDAEFLNLCAEKIEDHLRMLPFSQIVGRSRRAKLKQDWFFQASAERVPWKSGWWFGFGVSIYDTLGVVVPWLWRSGGRAWEDRVMQVLGPNRTHSRAGGGLVSDRGMVALARIPILENLSGLDVDRDPLVERVVQAFTAISATDLEAILTAVSEEGEDAADNSLPQ